MNRYNDTKRVSILGIIANSLLFIVKIIIAIISKSQGLFADAINSGTDIFASVMIYFGNKMAAKPNDKEHPYGHGKVEYVFSLIISLTMVFLSFKILQNSLTSIIKNQELIFSVNLVLICVATIIIKVLLYIYTIKISMKHENLLLSAAAEDHRNDIFISLATLIGIICSKYGMNYVDGIVGIIISMWIIYVATKIFLPAYYVLIDTDIGDEVKEKIKNIIIECNNCTLDSIKSRPIGVNYILLIEVSVDENVTFEQGHEIAENIKNDVCKFEKIVDAIIHVNPKQQKELE